MVVEGDLPLVEEEVAVGAAYHPWEEVVEVVEEAAHPSTTASVHTDRTTSASILALPVRQHSSVAAPARTSYPPVVAIFHPYAIRPAQGSQCLGRRGQHMDVY